MAVKMIRLLLIASLFLTGCSASVSLGSPGVSEEQFKELAQAHNALVQALKKPKTKEEK